MITVLGHWGIVVIYYAAVANWWEYFTATVGIK